MPAATPWEPRPLAPLEAQWDFGDELRKGRSLLEGTEDDKTPVAVWNFTFRPILEAMTLCLEEANRIDLVDLLPRYVLFRVGLGMLQPRRIDDVWDKESMHYNAYMAELFPSRRQFYVLQRLADPDADALIVGCSVLGRGAEPPQFWVLLIWLEPGISHVTWVHYDATMCLPCFVCSILPVLHFLRFDLCVL